MDFVVVGFGLGALMIVLGFAIRDVGPLLRRPTGALSPEVLAALRRRYAGFCRAVGNIAAVAGGVTVVLTLLALLAGVSDGVGWIVVLLAALLSIGGAALGIAAVVRQLEAVGPTIARGPAFTAAGATTAPTARRTAPQAAPAAEPVVTEEAAAPDHEDDIASFDANKLLASEFGSERDETERAAVTPETEPAEVAASQPSDEVQPGGTETAEDAVDPAPAPETEPAAAGTPTAAEAADEPREEPPSEADSGTDEVISVTVRAPERPATDATNGRVVEPEPEAEAGSEPEPQPEPAPPQPTAPARQPVFRSKLLADIGLDATSEQPSSITSAVLDEARRSPASSGGFQSPLLADLEQNARGANSGEPPKRKPLFSRKSNRG